MYNWRCFLRYSLFRWPTAVPLFYVCIHTIVVCRDMPIPILMRVPSLSVVKSDVEVKVMLLCCMN